jgi:sugar lactone lactonase YvrE
LLLHEREAGTTRVLLDGLEFANGVALAPDDSFVLVAETGAYRVLRYWLQGRRAGECEVFVDNLPGFPDNIKTGTGGIFWIALAAPRSATLDALAPRPFLRKLVARVPSFLLPAPAGYGFVIGVNNEGQVVYNLQDPSGDLAYVTSAVEYKGELYLASAFQDSIAVVPIPEAK